MPRDPDLSVIVPVFNQWQLVPELLDGLVRQAMSAADFELLLVDNGSSVVPDLDLPPFARLLSCETPGSYAARNHGAAHARGKWFAFTDADCRPNARWLPAGLRELEDNAGETIVAGGIAVVPRDRRNPSLPELYDVVLGMPQARYVRRGYGITANLFVARALFEEVGGFDDRRFSGGDADFCRRAAGHGASIRYCSEAVVEHPARRSFAELVTKVRRVKGGQLKAGGWRRRAAYAIRAFLPPVRAWYRALGADDYSLRERLLVCLVQGRLWLTEMAEVFRLLFGRPPERR